MNQCIFRDLTQLGLKSTVSYHTEEGHANFYTEDGYANFYTTNVI